MRFGDDAFAEALRAVPHTTRSLYIQSYQSLLFNCVATRLAPRSASSLPPPLPPPLLGKALCVDGGQAVSG